MVAWCGVVGWGAMSWAVEMGGVDVDVDVVEMLVIKIGLKFCLIWVKINIKNQYQNHYQYQYLAYSFQASSIHSGIFH